MSNYRGVAKHPETGVMEIVDWLDDYFGRRRYGVRFPDGKVFKESEIALIEVNGIGAESSADGTKVIYLGGSIEAAGN